MTEHQEIRPFRIGVSDAELADLRRRLAGGVRPPAVDGLARRWLDGYDWRKQEARLNGFPQFTTRVDGANLHFVHVRGGGEPILLLHGWPGSVADVLDEIAGLGAGHDVVAPSLPGHGFSGPLDVPGWTGDRIAGALGELMRRLGYPRYQVRVKSRGAVKRVDRTRARRPGESPLDQLAWLVARVEEWGDLPDSVDGIDRLLTSASIGWFTHTAGALARLHDEWLGLS